MSNSFQNTFGQRLEYLMQTSGIETTKKGANAELARNMLSKGCLPFYVNSDFKKSCESARSRIEKHRKIDSAANIEGKWLKAYCDYFNCSADYLFEYINSPSHIETDISSVTGLSSTAIKILKKWHCIGLDADYRYSWARNCTRAINALLEEDMRFSHEVLLPIADYYINRQQYEEPALSDHKRTKALKNFRLALFTANEGLSSCIKSIYKKSVRPGHQQN